MGSLRKDIRDFVHGIWDSVYTVVRGAGGDDDRQVTGGRREAGGEVKIIF